MHICLSHPPTSTMWVTCRRSWYVLLWSYIPTGLGLRETDGGNLVGTWDATAFTAALQYWSKVATVSVAGSCSWGLPWTFTGGCLLLYFQLFSCGTEPAWNSMDRDACWATVHGVSRSQTWLKRLCFRSYVEAVLTKIQIVLTVCW